MSTTVPNERFPSAIEGKLRSVRWRHAALAAAFAVVFAVGVLMVLMVTSMAIDWMNPFATPSLRLALTSATVAAAFAAACWLGIGPVRRSLVWDRAANAVDGNVPQLEERWTTVASLSKTPLSEMSAIQRAMAEQVTSEAIAMERIVVPHRVAASVSLKPAIVIASIGTVLFLATFALSPQQAWVQLRRFLAPTQDITATQLVSLTGDQLVPRGDSIELLTQLGGLPRSNATMSVLFVDGSTQETRLRPNDETPDQFAHSIRVDDSLSYRVRAGDAQTSWHHLKVIDFPEIAEVEFTIDFPDYTQQTTAQRDRMPRRIKVIQGSVLRLAIKTVAPVKQFLLTLSNPNLSPTSTPANADAESEIVHELQPDDDGWYRFEMQLLADVLVQPSLLSPHDLKNPHRTFSRIDVIADQAPVARVVTPNNDQAVAKDDTIEIEFEAHDDHGIMTAELVVFDESQTDADGKPKILSTRQIPLGDQAMQKHILGKTTLDLKELGIDEGHEISYAIRVTDNRNLQISEDSSAAPNNQTAQQGSPSAPESLEKDSQNSMEPIDRKPTGPTEVGRDDGLIAGQNSAPTLDEILPPSAGDEISQADLATRLGDKGAATRSLDDPHEAPYDGPKEDANNNPKDVPTEDTEALAPSDDTLAKQSEMLSDRSSDQRPKAQVGSSEASGEPKPDEIPQETAANATKLATQPADDDDPLTAKESTPSGKTLTAASDSKSQRKASGEAMESGQQSRIGQNTLTGRRRLKIAEKLSATATAEDRPGEEQSIRETVVEIDRMLAEIETGLRKLVDHTIADVDRGEQLKQIDTGLGNVEAFVADLRQRTKENQFAFVGLQMVDIARTHVTPARDHVFTGSQRPGASDVDVNRALQHTVRGRELLSALLKRYDRVKQEKKLEAEMNQAVTMYDVYLEKRRRLMREARQNLNPLERKMGVVEVDQKYLDRLAEVLGLRREMMEEFAQMLGDDPRLLSRYLELIKRRQVSLRDQLTEISQRQYDMTEEAMNWLQIDETQQQDLWSIIIDLRLTVAEDLAKDAAQLAERIEKQMPLEVAIDTGTAAEIIRVGKVLATTARTISFDAERVASEIGKASDFAPLLKHTQSLAAQTARLLSLLDALQFEHSENQGLSQYVEVRIQETRIVADQVNVWSNLSESMVAGAYSGIVETEQHRIAISTENLRMKMLTMETDLEAQFQQLLESELPTEIKNKIRTLHRTMESIAFHQIAASFRAGNKDLEHTSKQQQQATDQLSAAEQLFDEIRRMVVNELDQYDSPNPNIADLNDPTLDRFLAQLEREPSIAAQLGIPNRRTNLRILEDSMLQQESQSGGLGASQTAAADRVRKSMKMPAENRQQQSADAKKAQEILAEALNEIERQRQDPKTSEAQRRRLEELAQDIKKRMADNQQPTERQAEDVRRLLQSIASGEFLPDEQWNQLQSSLDETLWQVRGNRPPEAYRQAIEQYQDQIRELMQTIDE